MRRRTFVASGLGLMATAASQGFVWTFDEGLRAQPATAPGTRSNATGSPQGKWIRLAPFPQATGELAPLVIPCRHSTLTPPQTHCHLRAG